MIIMCVHKILDLELEVIFDIGRSRHFDKIHNGPSSLTSQPGISTRKHLAVTSSASGQLRCC